MKTAACESFDKPTEGLANENESSNNGRWMEPLKRLQKTKVKMYSCENCEYQSNRKSCIRRHNSMVHQGLGKEIVSCEICGKKIKRNNLSRHKLYLHKDPTMHPCSTCGKLFARLQCLKKHFFMVHHAPSPRKSRSISMFSENLLSHLPMDPPKDKPWLLTIDQTVKLFSVTKGKVYEVMHVLEALLLVTKNSKSTFQWNGINHMPTALFWLKKVGESDRFKMLERMIQTRAFIQDTNEGRRPRHIHPVSKALDRKCAFMHVMEMVQQLVMLFLVSPKPAIINLQFASMVLRGTDQTVSDHKSSCRRLYDIINVLQAIQIIRKVHIMEEDGQQRAAFEYVGPNVVQLTPTKEELKGLPQHRMKYSYFDNLDPDVVGEQLMDVKVKDEEVDEQEDKEKNLEEQEDEEQDFTLVLSEMSDEETSE